jgi:hypothetical protein
VFVNLEVEEDLSEDEEFLFLGLSGEELELRWS